jgi:hypothetical protein
MTTLQKIQNLTWYNLINNLKSLFIDFNENLKSAIPYKEYQFFALGQGLQPLSVIVNTFDNPVVFSAAGSGLTRIESIGAFIDLNKVVIDSGSAISKPDLSFNPTNDYIFIQTPNNSVISIKVYE